MTLRSIRLFLSSAVLIGAAAVSHAAVIGIGSFSGGETVINFSSIVSGVAINNQFAGSGVTFGAGLFGDPFPESSIQGTQEATNFTSPSNITNPITASFSSLENRIGFLVAGDADGEDSIFVEAIASNVVVFSHTFNTGTSVLPGGSLPSVFAGIEVLSGFDSIRISRTNGNGAFSIDDFRYEVASVPEPGTLALLGLGLAGLAATRRRKQ